MAVVRLRNAHLLILADGAGGTTGGGVAAEAVVRGVRDRAPSLIVGEVTAVELLRELDQAVAADTQAGHSTAVVVVVEGAQISGASVGDSGAWLIRDDSVLDLTRNQVRKPLIGSGRATPMALSAVHLEGRVLIASDGLLKYASRDRLQRAALAQPISQSVWSLIETVRLPSGGLPDDVSVILGELV